MIINLASHSHVLKRKFSVHGGEQTVAWQRLFFFFQIKYLVNALHILPLQMSVQVRHLLSCESLQLGTHSFKLSRREVDKHSKESVLAVLDAILGQTLLNGVLRVHEVNDLVTQTGCLHFSIAVIDQCS